MITLIANSGIQFYTKKISIDISEKVIPVQYYWQRTDKFSDDSDKYKLDLAYLLDDGTLVPKMLLDFDDDGNVTTSNFGIIPQIVDEEIIQINKVQKCLEQYESVWLPAPLFKVNVNTGENLFGPIGWARMMINEIEIEASEGQESILTFNFNLVLDTKISDQVDQYVTLDGEDTVEQNNLFGLSTSDNLNLNFLSAENDCSWIDEYILNVVHNGELPICDKPLQYVANFLYLNKYLASLTGENEIEKFILYPNNVNEAVDVDLILDIGNARTCGLLFEGTPNETSYNFTSVKKLKLSNLSRPGKFYDKPFSMRLAFYKAKFGDIEVPKFPNLFSWPSFLRLGDEASQILNQFDIPNQILSEPANTLSSPKRYLWDTRMSDKPWEFIQSKAKESIYYKREHVLIDHLNSQFTRDGNLVDNALDGSGDIDLGHGVEPKWSKSSLMVFVIIEILNHANRQINSHEFRKENDSFIALPRRLRRLVLTCPTGMTQSEQVKLRDSAKNAVEALCRYHIDVSTQTAGSSSDEIDLSGFNFSFDDLDPSVLKTSPNDNSTPFSRIEIVPSGDDISKPQSQLESKEDWIYDESSCSQINFIYSEIVKKYRENYKQFFDIYGKKILSSKDTHNSITIASVDIGGGTTDLMVCNYVYDDNQEVPNITPNPVYWETFNLAGDDLLKEIVNQVLIDGSNEKSSFCGIIRNYCEEIGCKNITDKILFFFQQYGTIQGASHNFYRKSIVHQILVPIAIKYIEQISSLNEETAELSYGDIFSENLPNEQLIDYINKKFGDGFDFKAIKWLISRNKINEIINIKFKERFKQISSLVYACKADFLLLSGKPSSIPEIRKMFVKETPITSDRIISLANYRVGTWYPFRDEKGYLIDAKTTVAVGAMIYALGGKYKNLNSIKFNTELLKEKLISTANYIGPYNSTKGNLNSIYFNKESEAYQIKDITPPLILGFKQLKSNSYPARPIFILDFNENVISEKVKKRNQTYSEIQIRDVVKLKLKQLRNGKYNIELERDLTNSKEKFKIVSVESVNGLLPVSPLDLELRLMTSSQPNGYWLDTGEFIALSHND